MMSVTLILGRRDTYRKEAKREGVRRKVMQHSTGNGHAVVGGRAPPKLCSGSSD